MYINFSNTSTLLDTSMIRILIISIILLCAALISSELKMDRDLDPEQRDITTYNQVSCFWSANELCFLDCISGPSHEISSELEIIWKQAPECHLAGLKLRIASGISFPNFEMHAKWLTANISISELIFEFRNVNVVQPNAFATPAFRTVKKTTITFASVLIVQNGVFNGFDSLRSLVFQSSGIKGFTVGCLDSVASTLEHLELSETTRFSSPLLVDGLTGGATMTALKTVKFKHNLSDTLTERSFVGLTSVTSLDLSFCQIQVIGAKAFDAIGDTIEELNLNNNLLVTFPSGLFSRMQPHSIGIKVFIDNNQWSCDCELCYFKWLLVNTNLFVQTKSAICQTPIYLRHFSVDSTNFCFDDNACNEHNSIATVTSTSSPEGQTVMADQTTASVSIPMVTITPTDVVTPALDENTFFSQDCYVDRSSSADETIILQKPDFHLKVMDIGAGEVLVVIEACSVSSVLIWYDNDGYSKMMASIPCTDCSNLVNCHKCGNNESSQRVLITGLNVGKAYAFCLVNKEKTELVPFSCVPHYVAKLEIGFGQSIALIGIIAFVIFLLYVFTLICRQSTRLNLSNGRIELQRSDNSKC